MMSLDGNIMIKETVFYFILLFAWLRRTQKSEVYTILSKHFSDQNSEYHNKTSYIRNGDFIYEPKLILYCILTSLINSQPNPEFVISTITQNSKILNFVNINSTEL